MSKILKISMICFVMIILTIMTPVYADTSNGNTKDTEFMNIQEYVSCGDAGYIGPLVDNIPAFIPSATSYLYNAVMVIVPIIIIILGSVDLVKGILSQKEDEMKKGRESFIRRLIGGVIVFLVVLAVKLLTYAIVGNTQSDAYRIVGCIDCFINNECSESKRQSSNSNSNSSSNSKSNSNSNSNLSWGSSNKSNSNHNYWGAPELQSNTQV